MQLIVWIILLHMQINCMFKCLKAGKKFCSPVLIADAQIMQPKWCLMSHFFAERRPFITGKICADRKIYQISKVFNVFFLQTASSRIRIIRTCLAQYTTCHNRKWFCIQILCHLKILHITKPKCHHITPDIVILLADFHIAN